MIEKLRIVGYRKFVDVTIQPHKRLNLLVGDNEAGKSTILEALGLVLTGRVNGRPAAEELNPYWFNQDLVKSFFEERGKGQKPAPPEILIEAYLENSDEFQRLVGAHSSDVPVRDCPGLLLRVKPNAEFGVEIEEHLETDTSILPVEYYKVEWRTFGDTVLTARPKEVSTAVIDSRTIRSTSGVDYHVRQMLQENLEPGERARVSVAYRKVKEQMTAEHLGDINEKMRSIQGTLDGQPLSLAMDQSLRGSWDSSVVPQVSDLPFAMAGQGQQAAIKIALALNNRASRAGVVMIEEPENHLSHTSLNRLLVRVETLVSDDQQLFVATHDSFVLNRLGLDSLVFVSQGSITSFADISDDTVKYFKRLAGYDTLRVVLADRVVLVEGPSDEILFEKFYVDVFHRRPIEDGIDVISMHGLALARCLEFAKVLGKKCAVLRDNDGRNPSDLRADLAAYLEDGVRELFVGDVDDGVTLEPQILTFNPDDVPIRRALQLRAGTDLETWMTNNKTEAALRLSESSEVLKPPTYFENAITFISGDRP